MSLSDKIVVPNPADSRNNWIMTKDVREFIKELKEFYKGWGTENELNSFLDKLAGEKLVN